jgi:hypothetical protein
MALKILGDNMQALHNMAAALLEYETIDSDEVNLMVQGGSLEEMKKLRDTKKEQIERDRKKVAEAQAEKPAAATPAKKAGGSDPMGQPGPVTA